MTSRLHHAAVLILLSGALSGPAASKEVTTASGLTISNAWTRATPPGISTGAAYLTMTTTGKQHDRLLSVTSPDVERVEIHDHVMRGSAMAMTMLPALVVPAGQAVPLAPGGRHLMLIGLRRSLVAGEKLVLNLRFARAGSIRVDLPVKPAWSLGPGR